MGSRPRRTKNFPARKSIRRSTSSYYSRRHSPHHKSVLRTAPPLGSSSVSDKLEALKNLIPTQETEGGIAASDIGSADQLFQETADYILLLRTQVSILQKLVDFYGSSSSSNSNDNHLVQQ